jgi:rhamnulokinase
VLGRLACGRMAVEETHRFANRPVLLPDGMRWNVLTLFAEALEGLSRAAERGRLLGVGVDAWGVDYALLDAGGRMLGLPFHYRDARLGGLVERVHARVAREELYAVTGIQTLAINTVYQLLADEGTPALASAERLALIPDLLNLWLTGELANESTVASTTGLLDARTGTWARGLIERLGYPERPFAGDPVDPGATIGPVLAHHPAAGIPVFAVAAHDTASAFVAAPIGNPHAAILSSGTWSLLGLETETPVLSPQAAAYNLTNERGVDGTIRLLRNIMGLWLVQECRRAWGGPDYGELAQMAEQARADVPLFDPDAGSLLAPGDMPARIAACCRALGQRPPETRGETVRSALTSLACRYRWVLERLELVGERDVEVIHVIGGGARNALLCRLTADLTGRQVLAGPVEATALGNLLVQARAAGELGSLAEMRTVAAASAEPATYDPPDDREPAEATYGRFLTLTRLSGCDAVQPART